MERHLAAVPETHEANPARGTFRRERDGKPLDPPIAPWEFPLRADCSKCGEAIRRKDGLLANWEHV